MYPCIAFFLNKLFNLGLQPESLVSSFSQFSVIYCGLVVSCLIFPLLILKDMAILVTLNSYGIYLVSLLLMFVIGVGIYGFANTTYKFDYIENTEGSDTRYIYLFGTQISTLAGTLSLGYFSHSFVLPLMKNNKNQENNKRDLFIGYILVMLTYIVVGIMGYFGFSGKDFKPDFKDNWFRFFPFDNIYIVVLRLINVFQLLTIFPVIVYIVRIQLFSTFCGSEYPSKAHVVCYTCCMCMVCLVILYFFADYLSGLMSLIGAAVGLFLIYLIPLCVNVVYYKRKHPENLEERQKELVKKNENKLITDEDDTIKDIDDYGISTKPQNRLKNLLFYISQGLIMCFGLFTLVLQFVEINFFGIEIKKNE